MKKVILFPGILIVIAIVLFIFFRKPIIFDSPEMIQLPKDTVPDWTTDIHLILSIPVDSTIYLNSELVKQENLTVKIDSMGRLGFNDSVIMLNPGTRANEQTVAEVMNVLKLAGKKLIIRK